MHRRTPFKMAVVFEVVVLTYMSGALRPSSAKARVILFAVTSSGAWMSDSSVIDDGENAASINLHSLMKSSSVSSLEIRCGWLIRLFSSADKSFSGEHTAFEPSVYE